MKKTCCVQSQRGQVSWVCSNYELCIVYSLRCPFSEVPAFVKAPEWISLSVGNCAVCTNCKMITKHNKCTRPHGPQRTVEGLWRSVEVYSHSEKNKRNLDGDWRKAIKVQREFWLMEFNFVPWKMGKVYLSGSRSLYIQYILIFWAPVKTMVYPPDPEEVAYLDSCQFQNMHSWFAD